MGSAFSLTRNWEKFFVHLNLVHGRKTKVVRAQIDSASTCKTMPETLLHKLFPSAKISKTRSTVNTYGSQTLCPKGQVNLCCDREGKLHTIDFPVVHVPQEKLPLLSGWDAQALEYLNIYADETHAVEEGTTPNKLQTLPLPATFLSQDKGNPWAAALCISTCIPTSLLYMPLGTMFQWLSWIRSMKN